MRSGKTLHVFRTAAACIDENNFENLNEHV